jgi:hypothetical protein
MRRARMGHAFRRRLRCNDYFDIDQRIHRGPCSISGGLFLMLQHGSIPMAIAVIIEFPGARRANYEKSVQLILKRRRNKLADWPVKGVLAHIAGPMPGGWRVIDVWRSRAAFTRFGKTLKPVLRRVGIQKVRMKIFPLTRFIKS